VAGLLAVMLAACSSGTSAEPSAAPSVEPTPQPTPTTAATPAPAASPAPTATPGLSVKVTFDGETCTYVGPTVLPDETMLRIEYAPDQEVGGSYLIVYGVDPGTTIETAHAYAPNGTKTVADPPDWVILPTVATIHGAGTLLYTVRSVQHGSDDVDYPVGGYQVGCNTPYMYLATQLTVAEG
jgi:hypothetical protein